MDSWIAAVSGLLDQREVTRCDVVGHSFGTIAGIELALTESQRVDTLTLAGGPAFSVVELFRHPLKTMWRSPGLALTVAADMCTAGLPVPRFILRLVSHHKWLRGLGFSSCVSTRAASMPIVGWQWGPQRQSRAFPAGS